MRKLMTAGALIAAGLAVSWIVQAGNLEPPPGPVGPTMKTLDQIEPRTPIHASGMPIFISASGSYYLAENISTVGNGIWIDADDVTLDLMGFTLSGGTGSGIVAASGRNHLTIRNGTVANYSGVGIAMSDSMYAVIERVVARNNGAAGMSVGANAWIADSTAIGNGANGISVGQGSVIETCIAASNTGYGIAAGAGTRISDSMADSNIGNGFLGRDGTVISGCSATGNTEDGFVIGQGTVISDCTAIDNGVDGIDRFAAGRGQMITRCTVMRNGGIGIDCAGVCQIRENTLSLNEQGGITIGHGCLVADNLIDGSGAIAGAAIEIINTGVGGNRIDNNKILNYDTGILIDPLSLENSVTRNDVRSGTNYDYPAGNDVATIVTSVVGAGPLDNISR